MKNVVERACVLSVIAIALALFAEYILIPIQNIFTYNLPT